MVRRSFRLPRRLIPSTVLILVLTAVAILLYRQWRERSPERQLIALLPPPVYSAADAPALADTLYARAELALEELGIWADLVYKTRDDPDRIEVRVPADLPLPVVNLHLTHFVEGGGGRVLRAVETIPGQRLEMRCGFDSVATTLFLLERERELRRRVGQIAIVLDDFGYMSWDESLIEHFCALPQLLTFAVLPNEGGVAAIVDLVQSHGHQVILHLPMEPDDPEKDPGEEAIRSDQTDGEIRQRVRQALRRVPGAAGVNNHMGSRATADSRVMEQVLQVLKEEQLFFLDSRTTTETVAYALAKGLGVPALSRDLFIDQIDDPQAIESQLWNLAALAARGGQAIGIGHDRQNTLLALRAVLPRLETRGFRFVLLSQLAR